MDLRPIIYVILNPGGERSLNFAQSNKDENLSLQDLIRQMAQLDFIKGQGKIDLKTYRLQYSELESLAANFLLKELPINKKE